MIFLLNNAICGVFTQVAFYQTLNLQKKLYFFTPHLNYKKALIVASPLFKVFLFHRYAMQKCAIPEDMPPPKKSILCWCFLTKNLKTSVFLAVPRRNKGVFSHLISASGKITSPGADICPWNRNILAKTLVYGPCSLFHGMFDTGFTSRFLIT